MTVENSRRSVLVVTTLALGAILLAAPAALAASPMHIPAKPLFRPDAQVHRMHHASAQHVSRPQAQNHVDDPFSSLILG